MTNVIFPESFEKMAHKVIPGATQWIYPKGARGEDQVEISVVGGGYGLYGDGVTSFEMWDFSEDDPQGHLSAKEINKHLNKKYDQSVV